MFSCFYKLYCCKAVQSSWYKDVRTSVHYRSSHRQHNLIKFCTLKESLIEEINSQFQCNLLLVHFLDKKSQLILWKGRICWFNMDLILLDNYYLVKGNTWKLFSWLEIKKNVYIIKNGGGGVSLVSSQAALTKEMGKKRW